MAINNNKDGQTHNEKRNLSIYHCDIARVSNMSIFKKMYNDIALKSQLVYTCELKWRMNQPNNEMAFFRRS